MALDPKLLVEQMRNQRKRWVTVADGKKVQVLLPTELEVVKHFTVPAGDGKVTLRADFDQVRQFTCDWSGFVESDLLGSAGASDSVPFDPSLWDLVAQDHLEWMQAVARELLEGIAARYSKREEDAGN